MAWITRITMEVDANDQVFNTLSPALGDTIIEQFFGMT